MATLAIEHCHDKHHGRSLTMALDSMGGYYLVADADTAHLECVCGLDRTNYTWNMEHVIVDVLPLH